MNPSQRTPFPSVSRRTALAGLGAGGLGVLLAGSSRRPGDGDAPDRRHLDGVDARRTGHGGLPGRWHQHPGPPVTQAGPTGVVFVSTQVGAWEPVSDRGVHFTGVQLHTDVNGALVGTVEIDAYPVVSDDGQTLLDEYRRSGPSSATREGPSWPICVAAVPPRPGCGWDWG